ncbi:ATP-binding protein [Sulfurimonas sp. C5]|uniref:tRNA 2-thiocytidine biosynthesis TtcA family protein n=1 Tax=Sulfurimonas sp. C5 TaxID=3036947 RepID=UPI0024574EA6|nr:ATP-binding protein [Sulfurimonas sp. C5]MDH4943651.1 ATP-binding protein [Sulfurimonas sp. C5]
MGIKLSKKIMSKLGKTNAEFGLIEEGDKILVGLSGGKDSLTLVHALKEQQRRAPFKFEFIAVTVTYGMGENYSNLIAHCKEYDIPHFLQETETYELAKEKIRKNSSFCSFFSRMRRGYLYSVAKEHGCNKVALGHHLDDAAESFFMNFIYNGQLRSLAPKYTAENGLVVIRPLIQMRERQLRAFVVDNEIEAIGDEACPAMRFDVKMPYARANTKDMLAKMEQEHPQLFTSLNAAFKNISFDSFFLTEKEEKEVGF